MTAGFAAAAASLAAGALALNRALVGVFYDDGLYAGLATALASGHGYVHPHLPGMPACIHYPPLYPLVLAPLFGALPLGVAGLAAKILNWFLAATAAGVIAWHATERELLGPGAPRWLPAAVVAAAATAIPVLTIQSVLFAEPLFTLTLAGTVALADRDRALAAGIAGALALLTRSIAVAAGAGTALYLLAVRRAGWRPALLAGLPAAVAGAAWGAWALAHRAGIDPALALNYGSYGEVLAQTGLSALGTSAADLPRPLAAITLWWIPFPPVRAVFGVAALAMEVYGLSLLARRSSVGLTLACYLAILAVWPYPADRFLWAVLPWLGLGAAAGALALWRRARLRAAVALVAGALALGFLGYEVRGLAGRWWGGAARGISANFEELLPAIRALPADAVIATDDEALVWLYTGRRAVPLYVYFYRGRETGEPSAADHRAYLDRQGVTHVVLASPSSRSARELRALIGAYPDWLVPVHRWPGGRWIYEVRRDA